MFWYNLGITLIEKFAIKVSLKFILLPASQDGEEEEGDSTIHTLCLTTNPNLITHILVMSEHYQWF